MAILRFDLCTSLGSIIIVAMLLFLVKVNDIKRTVTAHVVEKVWKAISSLNTFFFDQLSCSSFLYPLFSANKSLHRRVSANLLHRVRADHALACALDKHGNEMPFLYALSVL